MTTEHKILPKGWIAFVNDKSAQLIVELTKDGKYYGKMTVVFKPTKEELNAELERLKISLPK